MKVFVITLFAAAFLSVQASPKPGGYTLKGGVDSRYRHQKPAGYYRAAQSAGKNEHKAVIQTKFSFLSLGNDFVCILVY